MKWFDNTALTLVISGAVNWLLVGIFRFDLVAFLFGNHLCVSRFVRIVLDQHVWTDSVHGAIKKCLCHTIRRRGINVIIPSLLYAFIHFYIL